MDRELYINGELVDLGDSKSFPVTFVMNDIGDTKKINGTGTRTITIPATARNNKIFNHAINLNSISDSWFLIHDCTYIEKGTPIIQNGNCTIERVSDGYDLIMTDGIINLYDEINGLSIRDLNLDDLDFFWNYDNIKARTYTTEKVVCGYWDCIDGEPNKGQQTSKEFDPKKQIPGVYFHTIFDRIFKEKGFNYSGEIFNSDHYKNLVIPLIDLKADEATKKLNGVALSSGIVNLSTTNDYVGSSTPDDLFYFAKFNNIDSGVNSLIYNQSKTISFPSGTAYNTRVANYTGNTTFFEVPFDGVFNIEVSVNYSATKIVLWALKTPNNGNTATVVNHWQLPSSTITGSNIYTNIGGDRTLSKGEKLVFGVSEYDSTANNDSITEIKIKLRPKNVESTPQIKYGWALRIASNLPKIKQTDLIKFVSQAFGQSPKYDKYNKTLEFIPYKSIYENISNAKDWSSKHDNSSSDEVKTTLGNFAQNSLTIWKKTNESSNAIGNSMFDIPNKTLKRENTIFELPFAACHGTNRNGNSTALLPYWKTKNNNELELDEIKPRILLVDNISSIQIKKDNGSTESIPCKRGYFIDQQKAFNLDWATILQSHYSELSEMLKDIRVLKAWFVLTPSDIQDFDHYIPVYIDKYSSYFYVNKVKDFIAGQKTKCELIRL